MEKIVEGIVLHESVHCITIQKTYPGGAQGVACHGAPTANFTVTGGLVTQC